MGNRRLVEQFLVVFGLQLVFSSFLKIRSCGPVFFLVWILCLGWHNAGVLSLCAGFGTGLIYDFMVKGSLGWSSLLFTVIAYVNLFFPRLTIWQRLGAAVIFALFYFACLTFDPGHGFLWRPTGIVKYSMLFATYTAGLAWLVEQGIIIWPRKGSSVV